MEIISRKEAKAGGIKRYFTGRPCKRGHLSERFSAGRKCRECARVVSINDYRNNPKRKARQLTDAYREKARIRKRAWNYKNKAKMRETKMKKYWLDPAEARRKNRNRRAKQVMKLDYREKCNARSRKYFRRLREVKLAVERIMDGSYGTP